MGLKEDYDLTESETLRKRVTMALVRAALTIRAEPASAPNRDTRHAYAMRVIGSPIAEGRRVTWLVAAAARAAAVQGDDAALEADIAAGWDHLAGVLEP